MKKVVDTRGISSRSPLSQLKAELADAAYQGGWCVKVERGEEDSIVRFLRQEGIDFTLIREGEALSTLSFALEERIDEEPPQIANALLVIDSDCMGSGDEELGRTLMRSFINSLEKQREIPGKIVFYNRGVLLCKKDTDTGSALAKLHRMGVEVLVCGTCVDYFELSDCLSCGDVVNLFTLSSYILQAGKLIKL